ncbi:unnamed protein product (plasmid) [Mycetohabitans rhizoxinica HKI 454]|nr:unnamed protein product [Mycetohabitans rhizoxinica HKI 454]
MPWRINGEHNNGPHLPRRHRPVPGAVHGAGDRLRQAAPHTWRPLMMAWMTWLAGIATLLVLVYLVYALLRAEDLE